MSDALSFLIDPNGFFRSRVTRPFEWTIPAALVVVAGGLASGSVNLVSRAFSSNLPEAMQEFLERFGLVQSLLFLVVYVLTWPLIAGVIGTAAILFWNAEIRFRKLVELIGYAYLPFVLAGAAGFVLLALNPPDGLDSGQALDPGAVAAAMEHSWVLQTVGLFHVAAKIWYLVLASGAASAVLNIRWRRSVVCVAGPYLAYEVVVRIGGF